MASADPPGLELGRARTSVSTPKSKKNEVQEICQKLGLALPVYSSRVVNGLIVVDIFAVDITASSCPCMYRKEAEQDAAGAWLDVYTQRMREQTAANVVCETKFGEIAVFIDAENVPQAIDELHTCTLSPSVTAVRVVMSASAAHLTKKIPSCGGQITAEVVQSTKADAADVYIATCVGEMHLGLFWRAVVISRDHFATEALASIYDNRCLIVASSLREASDRIREIDSHLTETSYIDDSKRVLVLRIQQV